MKMVKKIGLGSFLVFCLLLLFSLAVSSRGSDEAEQMEPVKAEGRQSVRVGIVESPGYAQRDEHGMERGFDAEYTYKIAQYANLDIQFVAKPDYKILLDDLERGELDMAVGVSQNPERLERFIFADSWLGRGNIRICVRSEDDRFVYGNIEQLRTMRFGAVRGSSMIPLMQAWSAQHGFIPDITEFASDDLLHSALDAEEIDASISGGNQTNRYRVIMNFSTTGYYMVFGRDKIWLKNRIDAAMLRLKSENPLYEEKIRQRYRTGDVLETTAFTQEEKAYMAEHPVIRVAVIEKDAPYFLGNSNGEAQGVIPDYYKLLSAYCSMQFDFVAYASAEAAADAVRTGEADVVGMLREDVTSATVDGLLLTGDYTMQNVVLLLRAGESEENVKLAAVQESDAGTIGFMINESHSNIGLKSYPDIEAAYQGLEDDKTDAVVCSMMQAIWLINQHRGAKYTISNLGRMQLDICGGVALNNSILGSILSKAAAASDSQIDSIIARNTLPERDVQTLINRMPLVWIMAFFTIVILLLAGVSLIVFKANQQRVKARMAIAQAELIAAKQAREAEAEFLSNMSHDMRTPLNGILGFTELALQNDDEPQRQAYLEKIAASGRLMRSLVNDVLDLSKIASGKMEIRSTVFSLQQMFNRVVDSVRVMAKQKHLKLLTDGQGSEGRFVKADELRLQQVMLNLLSNAIKYTPEGGSVHCELSLTEAGDGNAELCLRVSDTGIGMSKEFQKHMFEPFSQEHRAESVQGTGLGLCIVQKIVGLMAGTIEVESQPGQGTVVTVQLRLAAAAAPAVESQAIAVDKRGLEGRRLLLCEDNEINAELARALLEHYGAQVDWAKNGQEGVRIFQASDAGTYDAILMDLRMPVLDGFAATRSIRKLARPDAAVPILALSADAYEEDVQKCIAAGMDGHVAKPLERKVLFAALEKVWQN